MAVYLTGGAGVAGLVLGGVITALTLGKKGVVEASSQRHAARVTPP